MTHPGGRPLKFQSVEELKEKIQAYFDNCWDYKRDMFGGRIKDRDVKVNKDTKNETTEDHGYIKEQVKPYTVGGLAVFLECSRDTLITYEKKEEFFDTIKRAKDIIYAYAEDSLFIGKNQAGIIFSMKNNYDWKDKTDISVEGEALGTKVFTIIQRVQQDFQKNRMPSVVLDSGDGVHEG